MNKIKCLLWLLAVLLVCSPALASREHPVFSGAPCVDYNGGVPAFIGVTRGLEEFIQYSPLDALGRVGPAVALLGPKHYNGGREPISSLTPSGFLNVQYEFVNGGSLYNRCHMIAHRLTGSGDCAENLFTGTAFLNYGVMLKIESQVADYITRTQNHVLYKVTPDFLDDELICRGIIVEAQSIETDDVSLCVYCFNVQPGVVIDYRTGESALAQYARTLPPDDADEGPLMVTGSDVNEPTVDRSSTDSEPKMLHYVLNTRNKKFHYPDCTSVLNMAEKNRQDFVGLRDDLLSLGYTPCGTCNP